MGIHDTVAFYQDRYGAKNLSVNAIGQAGERLSTASRSWVNEDDRAFGRGGTGAVGGSQEPEGDRRARGQQEERRRRHKGAWKQMRREGCARRRSGTRRTSRARAEGRPLRLRDERFDERHELASARSVCAQQLSSRPSASEPRSLSGRIRGAERCSRCTTRRVMPVPSRARRRSTSHRTVPGRGCKMESVEYEPAWALGANCDERRHQRSDREADRPVQRLRPRPDRARQRALDVHGSHRTRLGERRGPRVGGHRSDGGAHRRRSGCAKARASCSPRARRAPRRSARPARDRDGRARGRRCPPTTRAA